MAQNNDDEVDAGFAAIIQEFNAKLKAQGKTFEDLDAENEAKQAENARKLADDPELQKIWAEADAEAEKED